MAGKKGTGYTVEFKMSAVRIMQQEGLSPYHAEEKLGVTRETLSKWVKKYGPELVAVGEVSEIAAGIVQDIAKRESKLRDKYYKAKNQFIDHILETLPGTTDMDKLIRGLKVLCEVDGTMPKNQPGETVVSGDRSPLSYYNELSKRLEKMKHEPESNIQDATIIEGDSEEPA